MNNNTLPYDQWPEVLKVRIVKGVCIGACASPTSPSKDDFTKNKRVAAHAHCSRKDPYSGYICFRSKKDAQSRVLCFHELAHLITSPYEEEAHGKRWMDMFWRLSSKRLLDRIGVVWHLFIDYLEMDIWWWVYAIALPSGALNILMGVLSHIIPQVIHSWFGVGIGIVIEVVFLYLSMKFAVVHHIEKANADRIHDKDV